MQVGFSCFEVGLVRHKNITATAFKNVMDWFAISFTFFVVGYGIMFGSSIAGVFGVDGYALSGRDDYVVFLFQLAFAGTTLTIVSGAIAERTGFISYFTGAVVMGLLIYPIFGHWVWNDNGWLKQLGYIDFAGASVVHGVGAWTALVGVWMVGPRLGRYDAEGRLNAWKPEHLGFAVLGVIILWFGWWGFNGGSTYAFNDQVGKIVFNTNIAAAGGVAFFHCFFFQNKADLYEKTLGGILGGLVASTAACHLLSPQMSVVLEGVAGVLHNVSYDFVIKKMCLDDVVGAIPVHGVCGIWGVLSIALLVDAEHLENGRVYQAVIQLVGVSVCFVWTVSMAYAMYSVLKMTVGLRVSPQLEQEGLNIIKEFEEVEIEKIDLSEEELMMMLAQADQKD